MPRRPERVLRSATFMRELMVGRFNTVSLAAQAGVRKQVVAYLASGSRRSCSARTAEGIADALGCEVRTLFSNPLEEKSDNRKEEDMVLTLSVTEAGRVIGVSKSHAYRLVADGDLRVVDVGRKGSKRPKSRVPVAAIQEFIARREAEQS